MNIRIEMEWAYKCAAFAYGIDPRQLYNKPCLYPAVEARAVAWSVLKESTPITVLEIEQETGVYCSDVWRGIKTVRNNKKLDAIAQLVSDYYQGRKDLHARS